MAFSSVYAILSKCWTFLKHCTAASLREVACHVQKLPFRPHIIIICINICHILQDQRFGQTVRNSAGYLATHTLKIIYKCCKNNRKASQIRFLVSSLKPLAWWIIRRETKPYNKWLADYNNRADRSSVRALISSTFQFASRCLSSALCRLPRKRTRHFVYV